MPPKKAKPPSNVSMMYVTRGTVQVELKTPSGTPIEIRINPIQEFTVKYDGKDYIIFMPDGATPPPEAKAFEKMQTFSAHPDLKQALTDAALNSSRVEIKVDFSKTPGTIVSIKIPASFRLDTV
jgi:hypothetical protein